jgi:hypothetical protein
MEGKLWFSERTNGYPFAKKSERVVTLSNEDMTKATNG